MPRSSTLIALFLLSLGCGGDDASVDTDAGSTGGGPTSTTQTPTSATLGTTGASTGVEPSGDTSGSTSEEPGSSTSTSTDPGPGTGSESGGSDSTGNPLVGECVLHTQCNSGYCLTYQDSPPDPEATCARGPAGGATRFTATLYDFITGEPVPDVDVDVVAAVDALTNPQVAPPIFTATTDVDGRFDQTTDGPLDAQLGVLSLASIEGYVLTGTGLAQSPYGPGNIIHDAWMVPTDAVEAWSTALEGDVAFAPYLPLVAEGGTVGMVRDGLTGAPLAGATLIPSAANDAVVRYLDADGTGFTSESTSDQGVFVIGGIPAVAQYTVQLDGDPVPGVATAGSASGALFVMNFIVIDGL